MSDSPLSAADSAERAPENLPAAPPPPADRAPPRFGVLLLVCAAAVLFCGALVWFASTYLRDCCAP